MKELVVFKIIACHFTVNGMPRVLWFWIERKKYFHPSICHYWKQLCILMNYYFIFTRTFNLFCGIISNEVSHRVFQKFWYHDAGISPGHSHCSRDGVYSILYLDCIFVFKQRELVRGNWNSSHAYALYRFCKAVTYISLGLWYTRFGQKINLHGVWFCNWRSLKHSAYSPDLFSVSSADAEYWRPHIYRQWHCRKICVKMHDDCHGVSEKQFVPW
jgi:hypothetical protein